MQLSTLRMLVVAAIALLLIYQVGTWLASAFGGLWGVASAVVVAAVSFFSARLARSDVGNTAWFLVPTLLFTIIPLAATVWTALTASPSWFDRLVSVTPFLVGFVLPVLLLLLVYKGLRERTSGL
jgi:hypothetical protein